MAVRWWSPFILQAGVIRDKGNGLPISKVVKKKKPSKTANAVVLKNSVFFFLFFAKTFWYRMPSFKDSFLNRYCRRYHIVLFLIVLLLVNLVLYIAFCSGLASKDPYPVIFVYLHQQHHNHPPTPKNPSIPFSLGTHRKVKEQARETEKEQKVAASAAELSVFSEQTAPLSTPENKSRGQNGRPLVGPFILQAGVIRDKDVIPYQKSLTKKEKKKKKIKKTEFLKTTAKPFPVSTVSSFDNFRNESSPLPLSDHAGLQDKLPHYATDILSPLIYSPVCSVAPSTRKGLKALGADAGTFCSLHLSPSLRLL
ncbi:hypothetical protein CEXT_673351 [Caerostris extrusa]|uniref:Uncharacterized protein n=1 Tax=Caerostris extrusa TaxID=172846 RepID=A0AAV4Y8C3_CAEEX|nr:hypothetical protein CEXT_673351 [Caerostris extrusa]